MALDPLEREHLRKKMALRMGSFLESGTMVTCVGAHYYDVPQFCDLCQAQHGEEILVVKNRSGKKWKVAEPCLREMIRFKVTDAEELPRWLAKFPELRAEHEKRKQQMEESRREERRRLEKKVIVRKKTETP